MVKQTQKKHPKSPARKAKTKIKAKKVLKKTLRSKQKPIAKGKPILRFKTPLRPKMPVPAMKNKNGKENVHASEEDDLYAAEEQGIDKELESEEKEDLMEHGDINEDVYSKEGRKKLEEDEEIDPWEEGFMQGAEQAGQLGKDALTGEPLMDVEDVVEEEIDGKTYRFVNEKNAEKFRRKKEMEEEEKD